MASFFDKIKQSAQEASKKAQITVEVNRLKMQISSLNKEINRIYAVIGEAVYRQIGEGNDRTLPEACVDWARDIDAKLQEIAEIEAKIHELRDELICGSCGHVNPRESKFCSGCGSKLDVEQTGHAQAAIEGGVEEEILEAEALCSSCGHTLIPGKKFCGNCGQSLES